MMQVQTIVSYVDFSELSRHVLRAATLLARSFGARVLAAAAIPIPGVHMGGYVLPDSGGVLYDVDYAQAAQQLEEFLRLTPHQGVPVEPYMMTGDPGSVVLSLLARSRADVALLPVSGSRPLLMRMNLLQERLYRKALCPILSLNSAAISAGLRLPSPVPARRPPRILISTTLDPPSEPAVMMGMMLARYYSAETALLHVEPGGVSGEGQPFHLWQFLAGLSAQAQTLLSSSICPELINPPPKTMVRRGHLDREIVETAANLGADLLVVGARRPPLGVPLWPSLASRLACAAPCPVLVAGRLGLTHLLARTRAEVAQEMVSAKR